MSKQGFPFFALFVLLATLLVAGCTDDPLYPAQSIAVSGADMPALAGDAVYELWLSYPPERTVRKDHRIDHDIPLYFSVGRFVVDASGGLRAPGGGPAAFEIPRGYNPALVYEALVSVEPLVDDDTIPDAPMLWGRFLGDATRGHALLEAATPRTFDTTALLERSGSFVLETPTSDAPEDSVSGIWFLAHRRNPTSGEDISPGIEMPTLPLNHDNDNWIYEGWLGVRGTTGVEYVSLGRFRNPAGADDNGAGPAAGPLTSAAYRFPGEDFVAPRRRLVDSAYSVIVSLQPEAIALRAPLIRLLERPVIGDTVASGVSLNMVRTAKLPLIEVTIER